MSIVVWTSLPVIVSVYNFKRQTTPFTEYFFVLLLIRMSTCLHGNAPIKCLLYLFLCRSICLGFFSNVNSNRSCFYGTPCSYCFAIRSKVSKVVSECIYKLDKDFFIPLMCMHYESNIVKNMYMIGE